MSYYDLCCQHQGQVVQITEKCGKIHVGKIAKVDSSYVWIEPTHRGHGFGYGYPGYWGPGYGAGGYGAPAGYGAGGPGYGGGGFTNNPYFVPVALAGIGGFALGSAFFW
ncbi:hypothetical protein QA612_04930 [Evansella sp. AB-P1]|uniref:hypothetical protein n=1 Tax=Evansella sp. AB-P1 TaxID=3037653 RepID=UPI00241C1F8B|nr:hypothetical protein [Evansella sp. AB-P1]MDG5786827.1 hypothetical protein [Evansella sp. AB-P1]